MNFDFWSFIIGIVVGAVALGLLMWFVVANDTLIDKCEGGVHISGCNGECGT